MSVVAILLICLVLGILVGLERNRHAPGGGFASEEPALAADLALNRRRQDATGLSVTKVSFTDWGTAVRQPLYENRRRAPW